jgi:hypothetical protein
MGDSVRRPVFVCLMIKLVSPALVNATWPAWWTCDLPLPTAADPGHRVQCEWWLAALLSHDERAERATSIKC